LEHRIILFERSYRTVEFERFICCFKNTSRDIRTMVGDTFKISDRFQKLCCCGAIVIVQLKST
jgi:hypothetical protein